MVELDEFLHRKPAELSGGQRQRVALARAIVREPNVFLMDEPLSNLDAKLRVSTRAQIKNLSHELKVTTIYVTHDQIEAMTLADRVVVMKGGVVQQVGSPTEIYDCPANAFVASFIGSPAMNLVTGLSAGGIFEGDHIRVAGFDIADGLVQLGFRAEDASIVDTGGEIHAAVYTMELLGDATMITVRVNGELVSVKASKEYRAQIGDMVRISVPNDICHLFDKQTGARIGG
jgi:multiple sugar transport system ATP-binding protein